jgi:hypothetical protein
VQPAPRGTQGPRRLLPQHRWRPDRRALCHAGISLAAAVALGYTTASSASRRTLSVAESFMRQLLVSLVVLLGAGSTGYAQNDSGTLRGVYGPGQSAPTAPAAIGGIYGPGQSAPAALPQPSASPPDSGAAVPPAVLISGPPALGQALPIGINPIPIPGQPGYGTAIVNGHNAIVERDQSYHSTSQLVGPFSSSLAASREDCAPRVTSRPPLIAPFRRPAHPSTNLCRSVSAYDNF